MGSRIIKDLKRSPMDRLFRSARTSLMVCAVSVTVGTAGTSTLDSIAQTRAVTPFAVPANDALADVWDVERDRFATKLRSAFRIPRTTAEEFAGWILEAAKRQRLNPDLVASLVVAESSFQKDAISSIGAIGPAQVRAEYWQKFCGSSDLTDPEENIYCGAQILAHYQDVCGAEACALRSYNVGFYNRNKSYFLGAGNRYVGKIDRHRASLERVSL